MKSLKTKEQDLIRVGDLAKMANKTVRAIHYYEEMGLLKPLHRTQGGFRLFTKQDVQRVQVITQLQELGFALEQIVDMVRAWKESPRGEDAARRLREIMESGLRAAQKKITLLQSLARQIHSSLCFMHTCSACGVKPGRPTCTCCTQGDHKAKLPPFIDALM